MSSDSVPDQQSNSSSLQNLQLSLGAAGVGTWNMQFTSPRMLEWDNRCKKWFAPENRNILPLAEALSFISNRDISLVKAEAKKALNPGGDGNFTVTFQTAAHGENKCWIRLTGKVYFNSAGRPESFYGIAMNVTAEMLVNNKTLATDNLARVALKGTGVGLFHVNLKTNLIEYSPALAIILTGENNTSLKRKDLIDHLHPDDLPLRTTAYEASENSGEVFYELRSIWNDGTIHWVRTVGTYTYSEQGEPLVFAGTMQDITAQKQKEIELKEAEDKFSAALRQSEAIFRNVTSTSPTGLWMSDEQGKLIYLNQTLTDWTGMPYEMLLGHGWVNAIFEEDRSGAAKAFATAIATRTHYEAEFRISSKNSALFWCRAAGDPYYNEDGSYAGYVGFCMDIQEQINSINNLKVSEERLRTLIAQAPVAIGLLNGKEMVIQTANETILKLWGKSKDVIGMKLQDALPELKGQPFMQLLENLYDTGEPYYGYNTKALLERDGKLGTFYFDFTYTPIKDASDTITGVMMIATDVTAQVTSRQKIEESEARFRTLVKEAPVATSLHVGPEMKIEMANEAMMKLWGKDNSIIGLPLLTAIPELEGQPFLKILTDVRTTGKSHHEQDARAALVVNGELSTFYFNYTYKALRNEQGEVYAILNMAVDVSQQVLASKKLRESELFARSIIFNSPVAKLVFTGENMLINTINENMLAMLGRDESIIGKPFLEVMPELAETPVPGRMRRVLQTGETYYQPEEKIVLIKNGKPYTGYYNYTYKVLINTLGESYGVMVTATEVTEQVTARQKIEEAEESLRGAIELAELATWQIDLLTGVRHFSKRLRTWAGFDEDEVIDADKSYHTIAKKDHQRITASMAIALDPVERGIYEAEYTLINQVTKKERIIHATGKAFFNIQNQPYQIIGTAQDVTRQRKLQFALEQEVQQRTEELQLVNQELKSINEKLFESNEQLVRSNHELEQYAYVASHDLQEPLRKIRIFSGALAKQASLPEENKKVIEKIVQASQRMSQLIQDLLEFSRLLDTEIKAKQVDLSLICKAVTEDFELTITEKNATVKTGKMPVIEAVELQMNQLFNNLINNALKFSASDKPPIIEISSKELTKKEAEKYIPRASVNCTYHHITIADNGIGFDMKYSDQIFEVFKRLHGREKFSGSGIGLALCRRIVINHKGHLFAESFPGNGTIFHIILPDKFLQG